MTRLLAPGCLCLRFPDAAVQSCLIIECLFGRPLRQASALGRPRPSLEVGWLIRGVEGVLGGLLRCAGFAFLLLALILLPLDGEENSRAENENLERDEDYRDPFHRFVYFLVIYWEGHDEKI